MKAKTYVEQIEKSRNAMAKERDRLEEIINRATDLKDICDRAYDSLQEAIDALCEEV